MEKLRLLLVARAGDDFARRVHPAGEVRGQCADRVVGAPHDAVPPERFDDVFDKRAEVVDGPVGLGVSHNAGNLRVDIGQFGDARALSMADDGYAYVPADCAAQPCRVHVAFHGCRQGAETIGERFVREAGYNRWADTNRLIVLYPQAIARTWWPYNPRGCWDWWGYTGSGYATREGAQIKAVLAMVDRLGAPRPR